MRIIAGAIRNPIAIGVTVLLISLFGALSLKQLPLQLFPDIERPQIAIFTNWQTGGVPCAKRSESDRTSGGTRA